MNITAFAPASIGNFSVGFDILGMAIQPVDGTFLGDQVSVTFADSDVNELQITGAFASKVPSGKDNIVWPCLYAFNQSIEKKGINPQPLKLKLDKCMPLESGLGSSACSIVATLVALNAWYQEPLAKTEALILMGKAESIISGSLHYDNVAPCFLGGLQLMRAKTLEAGMEKLTCALPLIKSWQFVIAYSGINISTRLARQALPASYPKETVIQQTQLLANFITGLFTNNSEQALTHLNDLLAEPYRTPMLPGFAKARQHLLLGQAKAVGISGSGPTLFAIFTDARAADNAVKWLKKHYLQNKTGFVHRCHCNTTGTRVTQEKNG